MFRQRDAPFITTIFSGNICYYFGKWINTWKVLKCYVGKGWRRSVEPIMREMKKSYKESRREEYPTNKRRRKANWIGHIFV